MTKKYTKKQIINTILHWQKKLNNLDSVDEARHDGSWIPKHQAHRNPTDKASIYYIAVDSSADLRGYDGGFLMPNGNLTKGISNTTAKLASRTKNLDSLEAMLDKALAKYGQTKYIYVFKESYTYGTTTHKNHARPAVIDIWNPNGYWKYGGQNL